jgi:metal-dependent amidase/aminoacylase/carboxypeptidase family protein
MQQSAGMLELFRRNAEAMVGAEHVGLVGHRAGGTDMGDLGHVMPVLHPFAGGASGTSHGADFRIDDYAAVSVTPAKAMAMTLIDLLADGAGAAQRIISEFRPQFSRQQYLDFVRGLATTTVYDYSS